MTRVVLDTSALVSLLLDEPDGERVAVTLLRYPVRLIAEPSLFEARVVMSVRKGEAGRMLLDRLVEHAGIERVPFEARLSDAAIAGWQRFGRGRHPAGLNFGDCFAYALARLLGAPLLFVGDDFSLTDLVAA